MWIYKRLNYDAKDNCPHKGDFDSSCHATRPVVVEHRINIWTIAIMTFVVSMMAWPLFN